MPAPDSPEPVPAAKATIVLSLPMEEQVGAQIGRYKLLQTLGEGGCGIVYLAEQHEPVRRRVALKVIKLGMDTREVIARFELERQALAMMDHSNIAKVLDAGATDTGRPFFVMEWVPGIKITDYCDQNKLTTARRLDLFIRVCQAIQHAHQKGIIHRDLKPSNVLVSDSDGSPSPKIIDFGIAKATHGRLTDRTIFTAFEQFIGTPAYMSPEQAEMSGLDIDTRSDIYSLGVMLYELLTGRTPFDPKELVAEGVDGLRKILRDKEPLPPSTKLKGLGPDDLTGTAQRRRADPPRLISSLKGDLDWVVMKCLEKDRTRRYVTANGLAMDLRRFLDNEPVLARSPSQMYRFHKAVQRHRVVFASTAIVLFSLVLGLALTARALRVAQVARASEASQRHLAEQERTQAQFSEQRAKQAEATQALLRAQAEEQEQQARLNAYASDVNLAQQALAVHNLGRAQELLNRQRQRTGVPDLRGWEWRYLWNQCRSDALFSLCQLSNSVQSLAISPDGRLLVAGEQEHGGASVWDLVTRKELVRLAQGEHRVQVAFSPAQEWVACSSQVQETNRVRIWSAATREVVAEFGLNGLCLGLRFSGDGKTLLTATAPPDNKLTLWRVPDATVRVAYSASQATGSIGTPFAATGDLGVAWYRLNDGQTVCALDLVSGQELWRTRPSEEGITSLAVSPDGRLLAVGCGILDSAVRLLDAQTGREIRRLEGHRGYVIAVAFSSDGKTLYSGSADQTIRLWDVSKPADAVAGRVFIGHKLEVWSLAAQPNSPMLASGSKDGVINIWDVTSQARKQSHRVLTAACEAWAFSAKSNSVVTVSPKGLVSRWQPDKVSTNEILLELGPVSLRRCISRDARLVACAESDGTVAVWDVDKRLQLRRISAAFGPAAPVEFSGNNTLLSLVQIKDLSLHMWDLNTWQEVPLHFPGLKNETLQNGDAGALSGDGKWALLITGRGTGWLCDLANMRVDELFLDLKQSADAAFSPDSSIFAVASRLGYVRLWETRTRRELGTLRGVLLGLHSVAFSPDGRRLAAGSNGSEAIKLWDLDSRQELLTLEGQGSVFYSAAFSADGSTLGAMNSTRRLNLWTTPSWSIIESAERETR